MELYVTNRSLIFYGTCRELNEWLASFPEEWTLEQMLNYHLH